MAFTCPKCGKTSHHPKDEQYGYCGACHEFTGELAMPLRIVDYMDFINWTLTRETRESFHKTAETIKALAKDFFAKGGKIVWPHKTQDPPPDVTLTPYFANPTGFKVSAATLEEASKLRFHTGKKRLRTVIDCMADGLLVQELAEFEDED